MNTISHALIGYTASTVIFGPEITHEYSTPILISSTIMDLDHLPFILKHIRATIFSIKAGHANSSMSGILHRLHTQLLFLMAMAIAYFFADKLLISIISLNAFLHFSIDALVSNNSHVFYPFSPHALSIRFFGTHKTRKIADLASIPILALLLWTI